MPLAKKHIYAILIAATLAAAYLLFTAIRPPTLAFEDRRYPPGFRDLVLERIVSQPDPIFGAAEMAREGATVEAGHEGHLRRAVARSQLAVSGK